MKKYVAFVAILAFAFSLSAQFKTGMDFRTRAEMFLMYDEGGAGYDVPWERITDVRFRPWLSYTQNEYLTAKVVLEIGDVGFGNEDQGGAIGTDGINVQTKNLFLQVTPNEENTVVIGLQPYRDFHRMILDSDIAGISWRNKYDDLTSYVGWFASYDDGEFNVDGSTYSMGSTEFIADFEYKINDEIKVGVNNLIQLSREQYAHVDGVYEVHGTSLNLWAAPYFAGSFNEFYVEAVLGLNNIRPDYEVVMGDYNLNTGLGYEHYRPQSTGIALSLKSKYDINDDFDFRFNFLFRDGDGSHEAGWNLFYGLKSYYDTGLEILTEKSVGLDRIDRQIFSPFTSYETRYHPQTGLPMGTGGIILPSLFLDYNMTDVVQSNMPFINDMKLILGLGYAMSAVEIRRNNDPDEPNRRRPETYIGTEIDIKAQVRMFDDLIATPYLAIMFPGDWYNYEGNHDHFFTKIGLTLNTRLR